MSRSAGRNGLTWFDVIIAAMLVVIGRAAWDYASIAVARTRFDRAPTSDEFLLSEDVRSRELKVEDLKAGLATTRTKAIEEEFIGEAAAAPYRDRVSRLEREVMSAEKAAFEARRGAMDRFEAANFRASLSRRLVTLPIAIGFAAVALVALRTLAVVTGSPAHLKVHWGLAARIAACVVAPMYGFETAGAVGAVFGAAAALLLLVRP